MNTLLRICYYFIFSFPLLSVGLYAQSKKTSVESTHFTISGYIIDERSKETLLGANIYESNNTVGTSTNEYGFYSITLPKGKIRLRITHIGYQTLENTIDLNKNFKLDIQLKASTALDEVVIYGNKGETGVNATHMGAIDIPLEQIKNTPSLFGEPDVMKTIQLMPGVQSGTEGSAGVYVRGGGPDENLILLDGVPLYNVDHVFGFFSVFNPESVKKVSLFKSSFPARFGGRLSSVIDVRTNDGNMRSYHGTIGIGLLSAKAQFEGPIVKDRTAFNISARRSYIDLISRPFMGDDKFTYYFYDINAKINHKFNDKHRLYLSLYNGKDKFGSDFRENWGTYSSEDNSDLQWGNFTTALRWNYLISPKLFSNTTVAYTRYNFSSVFDSKETRIEELLPLNNSYSSDYSSGIKDWSYNIDFDYLPTPTHHFKFGTSYLYHSFKPEVLTSRIKREGESIKQDTLYNSISNSEIYAHEITGYLEDNADITEKLSLNAGVHLSLFRVQQKSYFSMQPRISARYQLFENLALKASYTQMNQNIHLLSSYAISMPTDIWVPSTKNIKPMKAHQYSLGTYYSGIKNWTFSVEAYYKDLHNILEYRDGFTFMGSSYNWEDKVEMGKGRAMGIEFMAQKTIGKTTGWIAYTLAKSDRQFFEGGINNGVRFPYKYDRRHNITLTFTHKFSDKFDLSAAWRFNTGGTTTIAQEKTIVIRPDDNTTNPVANLVENRNNYRLPGSHYLSIGANFNRKTKHGSSTWNITLYNVYNAMNPTLIYRDNDGYYGDGKPVLKKVTILPLIPSVSYIYKF